MFCESTSPSGEKLRAEIAVATDSSESPPSKLGSPGGPLASKTFIAVILYMRFLWEKIYKQLSGQLYLPQKKKKENGVERESNVLSLFYKKQLIPQQKLKKINLYRLIWDWITWNIISICSQTAELVIIYLHKIYVQRLDYLFISYTRILALLCSANASPTASRVDKSFRLTMGYTRTTSFNAAIELWRHVFRMAEFAGSMVSKTKLTTCICDKSLIMAWKAFIRILFVLTE